MAAKTNFTAEYALATSTDAWTQIIAADAIKGTGYLIFDNTDSAVAFQVSLDAGVTGHFRVKANKSFTTPKETNIDTGVYIKRIGGSNVASAQLYIQM